jgi:hypothetical protein
VSPDATIFRTFRLVYWRRALRTRRMALVAPHLWDDPFENLVASCAILNRDGGRIHQHFLGNFRKPVYGQCWTFAVESDAHWRMYSTVRKHATSGVNRAVKDEGVRVRTTAERLMRALWSSCRNAPERRCYLGAVRYYPHESAAQVVVNEIGRSRESAFGDERGHAESLFIKRQAFDADREVRLVFVGSRGRNGRSLRYVPIDPNALFDEVVLDPRLGAEDERARQEEFRSLGFGGPVGKSGLYQRCFYEVPLWRTEGQANAVPAV